MYIPILRWNSFQIHLVFNIFLVNVGHRLNFKIIKWFCVSFMLEGNVTDLVLYAVVRWDSCSFVYSFLGKNYTTHNHVFSSTCNYESFIVLITFSRFLSAHIRCCSYRPWCSGPPSGYSCFFLQPVISFLSLNYVLYHLYDQWSTFLLTQWTTETLTPIVEILPSEFSIGGWS